MEIQTDVITSIIVVTVVILALLLFVNGKLKKFDPLSKPTGIVLLTLILFDFVRGIIHDACKGKEDYENKLTPYFTTVIVYIFLSNILGLFSLTCPTSCLSVTATLAIISFIMIEKQKIQYNGVGGFIHGFFTPFPFMAPANFISEFATPVSLSMRLFGNILSGGVLMSVLYQLFNFASAMIPVIGSKFNLVAVLVCPALHFYFDLFSGVMQAFIFTTLSINFIGNEIPGEN